MGLSFGYLGRRILVFVLVVWGAATINFFLPRLAPGDPMGAVLMRMTQQGIFLENQDELIAFYRAKFGLDDPLYIQYLKYLRNMMTFDMGYSLSYYPTPVREIVMRGLPWTIGLLSVATILAFSMGTTIGALMGWRTTPKWIRNLLPFSMTFASIPSYILALVLIYIFVYGLEWFPAGGGYGLNVRPGFTWSFIKDVLYHAILPLMAVAIVAAGGWALGMRGMMITIHGDDYIVLAQAKGLSKARVFWQYAVRNALLPQITALAMSLGGIVSGSALVETWFSYPGMGWLLSTAVSNSDYTLIQGITFIMVLATALAVLMIDLLYPRIDPRITYQRR
jgi:peptide/nickel transport system permease protein